MSLKLFTKFILKQHWTSNNTSLFTNCIFGFHTSTTLQQATTATQVEWKPTSIRTGVIAKKKGMTSTWTTEGIRIPVTVLQLEEVIVTDIRESEKHGYTALQVGCTPIKEKHVTKPLKEHFNKLGISFRRKLSEFKLHLMLFYLLVHL
ncbi:unnamed protein product [Cunninghamella echinulata]